MIDSTVWTGLWVNVWLPFFLVVLLTYWKEELLSILQRCRFTLIPKLANVERQVVALKSTTQTVATTTVGGSPDFIHLYKTETTWSYWKTENGATFQELHPGHGAEDVLVLHVRRLGDGSNLWGDLSGSGRRFKEVKNIENQPDEPVSRRDISFHVSSISTQSAIQQSLPNLNLPHYERPSIQQLKDPIPDIQSPSQLTPPDVRQIRNDVPGFLHRSTPPPTYQESIDEEEVSHNGNSSNHPDLGTHNQSTPHQEINQQTTSGGVLCSDVGVAENVWNSQQITKGFSSYKKNQEYGDERVGNAALRTSSIKSDTSLSLTLTDLHCPTEASEQPESLQSKAPESLMSSNQSNEQRRVKPDKKEAKLTVELPIGQSASSASVTPQGCIDNTSAENAEIKNVSQIVSVDGDKSEEPVNSFSAPEVLRSRSPSASLNDHVDESLADKDCSSLDATETQEESADEDDGFDSGVFEELVLDLERYCEDNGINNFQYLQDPGCLKNLFVFGKDISAHEKELKEKAATHCSDYKIFPRDREVNEDIFTPLVNDNGAKKTIDDLKPKSDREFTFLTWKRNMKGEREVVEYSRCDMLVQAEDKNRRGHAAEPDIWALLTAHHIFSKEEQGKLRYADRQNTHDLLWDSKCAPSKGISYSLLTHMGVNIDVLGPPIWRFWRDFPYSGYGQKAFDKFYNDIMCIRLDRAQLRAQGLVDKVALKSAPTSLSLTETERQSFRDKGIYPLKSPDDMRKFYLRPKGCKSTPQVFVVVDGKLGKICIPKISSNAKGYQRGQHIAVTLLNKEEILEEGTSGAIIRTIDKSDRQGVATGMLASVFADKDLSCGAIYEGVVLWPALRQLEHYQNEWIANIGMVGGDELAGKSCDDVFGSLAQQVDSGLFEMSAFTS